MKKFIDFKANISEVKQINPLFSTCKVRVLYTGVNRNYTSISKNAVEKALPSIQNIPIVGEYSVEGKDFKGHGGKIDLDTWSYIHTTKPYGVVPESATFEWEEVKGKDGTIREYLTIDGCYLWTGRYEEAYTVIENGKGQSMEIEVTDGRWDEEYETYQIDNFNFSALCILGDGVEPAFEDAKITAYSKDKGAFDNEFKFMLKELETSLSKKKEVIGMNLKQLLEKYSLKVEDLTAKGIDFNTISEDEIEDKIVEAFELEKLDENGEPVVKQADPVDPVNADPIVPDPVDPVNADPVDPQVDYESKISTLETELATANDTIQAQNTELDKLRSFKLNVEKADHESKVQELFTNFQLSEEDVKDIEIHDLSLADIEEKCYAILGRKISKNQNFNLSDDKKKANGVHIKLDKNKADDDEKPYGGLIEKYSK